MKPTVVKAKVDTMNLRLVKLLQAMGSPESLFNFFQSSAALWTAQFQAKGPENDQLLGTIVTTIVNNNEVKTGYPNLNEVWTCVLGVDWDKIKGCDPPVQSSKLRNAMYYAMAKAQGAYGKDDQIKHPAYVTGFIREIASFVGPEVPIEYMTSYDDIEGLDLSSEIQNGAEEN